jgi:hypothetical protein
VEAASVGGVLSEAVNKAPPSFDVSVRAELRDRRCLVQKPIRQAAGPISRHRQYKPIDRIRIELQEYGISAIAVLDATWCFSGSRHGQT